MYEKRRGVFLEHGNRREQKVGLKENISYIRVGVYVPDEQQPSTCSQGHRKCIDGGAAGLGPSGCWDLSYTHIFVFGTMCVYVNNQIGTLVHGGE